MACKYYINGKESKLYTDLFGYMDDTMPELRSQDKIIQILTKHKLINRRKGNLYVQQGEGAKLQLNELDRMNSVYPGMVSYEFIRNTEATRFSPFNKLFSFSLNMRAISEIPTAGPENADIYYEDEADINKQIQLVSGPNSAFGNDYFENELARRENTSDQSRMSDQEREDEVRTQEKVTHLKNVFSNAGVEIEVVMDNTLGVLGQVDAHEIGKPVTVRLNPELLKADTVYHEFGHIYIDMLGVDNPAVAQAIAELQGTELYKQVELAYPELSGEMLDKEVLATAIGREGAKITRTDPSPLQVLINKIFRAFSNMLNKLGIKSTPSTAATLAQEMFANNLRATDMVKPLSIYTQQSRGEVRLKDLTDKVRAQVEGELADIRKMPESAEKDAMVERQEKLKISLTQIKNLTHLSRFISHTADEMAKARTEFDRLVTLGKQSPEEAAKPKNANAMYELKRTMDSMSVIKSLKQLVKKELRKDKKRPSLDQNTLDTMDERIAYIVDEVELLEDEYSEVIIPLIATALLPLHNKRLDPKIQEQIDNLKEHGRYRGKLNTKTDEYRNIKQQFDDGRISEEKFEEKKVNLAIEQLENSKILNRGALIQELRSAYKDKSGFSFYFDPIIYSNDQTIQMFAKLVDTANIKANQRTLELKGDLNLEYTEFASGRSESDVKGLNEDLQEEIEMEVWQDGKTVKMNLLGLVQPLDINKYNSEMHQMYNNLAAKYNKPLSRDYDSPEDHTAAYQEWSKHRSTVERYTKARDLWFKENTEPIVGWQDQMKVLNEAIQRQNKFLQNAKDNNKLEAAESIEAQIQRLLKIKKSNITSTGTPKGDWVQPKASNFTNPKYTKIQADPRLKRYYDFVLAEFQKGHTMVGKNRSLKNAWDEHTYLMPSIRKEDFDRVREQGGISAGKDMLKDSFTFQATDDIYGNYNSSTGELSKRVPVYYTNAVDAKDVSRDIASSLYQFRHMAHNFVEKSDIVGHVMMMRDVMAGRETLMTDSAGIEMMDQLASNIGIKLRKRKDGESWALKHLNEFIDMDVFGQKEIKTAAWGIDLSKAANALNAFTAINNLSFNFLQAGNQTILDNMTTLQEGVAGEFMSTKDLAWAKTQYWKEGAAIKDIGKFQPGTKLGKAIEFFDALTEVTDREGNKLVGSKARKLADVGNLMMLQQAAEHEMAATRMLGLLHATEALDSKGNPILNESGKPANIYDMLLVNEKGVMTMDPKVANVTQVDLIHLLRGLARRTNQTKGSFDRSMLERRWYGRLFMLFRRYAVPGIRRRYGHGRPLHMDEEMGTVTQGMYVSFANMVIESYKNKTVPWAVYDTMTDMEKQNVKRTLVELSALISASVIVMALANIDDEDETWLTNFMLYQAKRYETEIMQWNPLVGYKDVIRMTKSPTATIRPFENGLGLLDQILLKELPYALGFPTENKDIFYQRSTGRYAKGDRKIRKKFDDLMPVVRGIEKSKTPEEAYKWFNINP